MGHDVDEATNRHDGLAMLIGDDDIGIVVLDLGLPPSEHDSSEGLAFLHELAKHHHRAKVIVLTGHSAESIATQCIAHGAFDHIVKPFTSAQIRQSVQRADLFYRADNISATSSRVAVMVAGDPAAESVIRLFHEQPMEKLVRTVLTQTGHNVSEAARRLRIRRANLYYYINKFGITRSDSS
jgi:DNA-binding NtrC family response regulator